MADEDPPVPEPAKTTGGRKPTEAMPTRAPREPPPPRVQPAPEEIPAPDLTKGEPTGEGVVTTPYPNRRR